MSTGKFEIRFERKYDIILFLCKNKIKLKYDVFEMKHINIK